jgi:hypothetical protein
VYVSVEKMVSVNTVARSDVKFCGMNGMNSLSRLRIEGAMAHGVTIIWKVLVNKPHISVNVMGSTYQHDDG